MGDYAGVLLTMGDEILLVREHHERAGAPLWNPPGGRIEDGESPTVGAVRELREEAGCMIEPARLELVSTVAVVTSGIEIGRAWNFTATTEEPHIQPDDPDNLVLEARWFPRSAAMDHASTLSYAPVREPLVRFLRTGVRGLHWTFELPAGSDNWDEFTWSEPISRRST